MRDTEISLPPGVAADLVERAIDEAIAQSGLNITLRDTLKKFPGCVHWHLKLDRKPGTLEVTLWPEQQRAWFTVQKSRTAPWVETEMKRLEDALQQLLVARPTPEETA